MANMTVRERLGSTTQPRTTNRMTNNFRCTTQHLEKMPDVQTKGLSSSCPSGKTGLVKASIAE